MALLPRNIVLLEYLMRSVSKLSFAAIFALLWAVAGSSYSKSYKMYKADWNPAPG